VIIFVTDMFSGGSMKVVMTKKIEGCLEGTNVYDILFDCISDKKFIDYLSSLGTLSFNDQMAKPYYRIICRGKYTIRGSVGNHTIRVTLPENAPNEMLEEITNMINSY
jgi:hypothetical protein